MSNAVRCCARAMEHEKTTAVIRNRILLRIMPSHFRVVHSLHECGKIQLRPLHTTSATHPAQDLSGPHVEYFSPLQKRTLSLAGARRGTRMFVARMFVARMFVARMFVARIDYNRVEC
jgi:hypothetical protein